MIYYNIFLLNIGISCNKISVTFEEDVDIIIYWQY